MTLTTEQVKAIQKAIDAYQAVISTAQDVINSVDSTRQDVADARAVVTQATNIVNALTAAKSPQGQRIYYVKGIDTLPGIAQRELGNWKLYRNIKALNHMKGDAIYQGQPLIMPPGAPPQFNALPN